jgi:hypothetical protein
MTAILPESGQFDTVKASLNAAWFANFDTAEQSQLVSLTFPKFTLTGSTVSWKPTLQTLGITSLFTKGQCDLSGINFKYALRRDALLRQAMQRDGKVFRAERGGKALGLQLVPSRGRRPRDWHCSPKTRRCCRGTCDKNVSPRRKIVPGQMPFSSWDLCPEVLARAVQPAWDIMALVGRAILLGIVILAPGGLLLLPFLAAHQWKKTQKSKLAHAH